MVPWSHGQYLAWDATVVHTCAASYLSDTLPAAEQAAINKFQKYAHLPPSHVFVPIALETLGRINSAGTEFLSELGSRLTTISGDPREGFFLFQRLSVCLQKYNAVAFRSSFFVDENDNEA